MTDQHNTGPGRCPVCDAALTQIIETNRNVQAILAERYGGPVKPARWAASTPDEIAARLRLLADLPHDPEEPA